MFALVVALAAASPAPRPAEYGGTAWIFSTIGQSEFCPPGDVIADLQTGRYTLTVRAPRRICNAADLERRSVTGTLTQEKLAQLRAAFVRATAEGLERPVPRPREGWQDIVITNGGTPTLVLKTGRGSVSAPDEITRWSAAATALHDSLDNAFDTRSWK